MITRAAALGLTLHLCAAPLAAQAGVATIAGSVLDTSGIPLPRVIVYLDSAATIAQTDSAGSFRLEGVGTGPHTLHIRGTGWQPRSFTLAVPVGSVAVLDVGPVLLGPGPAPAATLTGSVRDRMTGTAVASAEIALNGRTVAATDQDGTFTTDSMSVTWGANLLAIRRVGYAAAAELLWIEDPATHFDLAVLLRPVTVLPEVEVVGDRVVYEFGRLQGFRERREHGFGTFITREDIEQRRPLRTTDLLRAVPGLSVGWNPNTLSTEIRAVRGGSSCRPIVYVDGLPFLQTDDLDVDRYLLPDEIAGIEIYRGPSEVPPRFNVVGTSCGAVVIWTR